MNKCLSIVCLWLGAATSSNLQGQATPDDCIRYAWQHNLSIQRLQIATKEARADYVSAIGKFLPQISMKGEVGRYTGRSIDPRTNGYTSEAYNQGTAGLEITLSLFEGFSRINLLKLRSLNREEKMYDLDAGKNELAIQITEAYYKAALNEQLYLLAEEQLELGNQYLKQAHAYYELGLKSAADVREIEARRQGDLLRYIASLNNRRLSLLYLKELMGMEATDSLGIIPIAANSLPPRLQETDPETLYRQAVIVLPEYKSMQIKERAARKDYAMTRGEFFPAVYARFSLNSDYYNSLYSLRQLREHRSNYIGIGFSFPLFTGLERYTRLRKKRLNMLRMQNELTEKRLRLRTETERLSHSLRTAWEEHRQVCLQADAERQVLQATKRKWEEGASSTLQLMEARSRWLSARSEQVRVQAQYELLRRLIVYYQTGTFIHTDHE
ncbi:MAG: TolC family protein [Bacteroides pyogenes]|uniref:TolC family protein n=1 Tax=Bacteroides pyogenes TaxID=310300 RepID=UPI00242CD454|nr:TolC family protein [Bacteroides pyogenes]MCI7070618.1 TolC family protein [Bacteroides pyogenes]